MEQSRLAITVRYLVAIFIVLIFVFPIFWFALTSLKPISAVFDKDGVIWFDFVPTLENYRVTLLGESSIDVNQNSPRILAQVAATLTMGAARLSRPSLWPLARLRFVSHWVCSQPMACRA